MTNQEELVRMRRRTTKRAIDLAMEGKWREAVDANKSLIESFADDVDSYNRLGRAYMELGEYQGAREAYSRALLLDPYNMIARKNVSRLQHLGGAAVAVQERPQRDNISQRVDPHGFIEETGKTGVVSLYRLAPVQVVAAMVAGDKLELRVEGPNLIVENGRGDYLGVIEPRHAQRLIRLINGGNRYSASVVSVGENSVSVFIREEYQDLSQEGILSFPPKGFDRVRNYINQRLRRELETGEEDNDGAARDRLEEGDMSSQDSSGYEKEEEDLG